MCMTAMITSPQQQATLAAASPLYTQTKTVRAGPQAPRTHALGEPSTHGKWTCPMPYNTHSCTIALPPAIGRRPAAPWSTASSVPRTRWHGQCRLHTSQHDQKPPSPWRTAVASAQRKIIMPSPLMYRGGLGTQAGQDCDCGEGRAWVLREPVLGAVSG